MNDFIVLCVDDEAIILESLKMEIMQELPANIHLETATGGEEALTIVKDAIAAENKVIMVISDQRMPVMTGDKLLAEIHDMSPDTLNILLTGYSDINAIQNAVNKAGLYRYISKPWEFNDLILTVKEAIHKFNDKLLIDKMNKKIERLTLAMVGALENANYYNDNDTGNHVHRVGIYSSKLAELYGKDEDFVQRIKLFAPLHDIGKVGIDPHLLKKMGKYTPEEFNRMKEHVLIGGKILTSEDIDEMAKNIALYHHEKWDGSGYCHGLKGTSIPIEARIVSIIDIFDALISKRCYKEAFPLEKTLDIIKESRGIALDPDIVDLFLNNISQFQHDQ